MSTWKLTALVLALGLVFCGAANAAVATLTLSMEIVNYDTGVALTLPEIQALTTGSTYGVAVYGEVANASGYGIDSASYSIYSGHTADNTIITKPVKTGIKTVVMKWGSFDGPGKALATIGDFANSPAAPDGSLLDPDVAADDALLTSISGGWSGAGTFGAGAPALLAIQQWTMVTAGPATLYLYADPRAEYIDDTQADYTSAFGAANVYGSGSSIVVGPSSSNTPPTIVTVSQSQITESDWDTNGGGGYNNLLHSIDVSAVGADEDGDPLTYRWMMSKPGGGSLTLATTGAALRMTLADIASLVLPEWTGPGNPANIWDLTVEAFDGIAYSAPTHISTFVPEPATMGLLAFGVVGLLKRRRRA